MLGFLLFFSQVVLIFSARISSEKEEPTCQDVDDYNVCHYNGVLVQVTERSFNTLLDINDLNLLEIREDTFKNVTALYMRLNVGNRISVLKRKSFRGLPNLEHLNLNINMVPLADHLFAELIHLQSLSLMYNKINTIPKDSFAGLSKLKKLFLSHNDIEAIEAESFSNLNPKLLYLWLNSNKISRLATGTFAELTELKHLNLDHNQLETLPNDAFRGLNKLEYLFLSHNRITSVSRALFRDLVGLKRLNLQHNEISMLDPGTFQDLSQLGLDDNNLSHIVVGTFAGLSKLNNLML